MTRRVQQTRPTIETAEGDLDPALLRIIQAMARADARRDFAAAQAARQPLRAPAP